MITNTQKQQILHILQSPQWQAVEDIANEMISQIKEQPSIDETEWKTLQNILTREGEIRGIRRFIQELYNLVKQ